MTAVTPRSVEEWRARLTQLLCVQAASEDGFAARGAEVEFAAQERLGWQRMCLQVLFFVPKNLLAPQQSFARFAGRLIVSPVVRVLVFSNVSKSAHLFYPTQTPEAQSGTGQPSRLDGNISHLVIQGLFTCSELPTSCLQSQRPADVAAWVDDIVSSWSFRRVVPCHLDAPIAAGPADLRCTCLNSFSTPSFS